jgi:catechol 2,3-dioxygenase-like lactoylglutathione lyase family enzyme
MKRPVLTSPAILLLASSVSLSSQPQPQAASFHHLHLNSVDPAAAIAWYTKTFPVTARARVAGLDGISSEKIHVLFSKVGAPPDATLNSAIWHFGWGSPDMPADFAMHQANGVRFATPLSTLAQGTVFAYMNGPDGALVEINSAPNRALAHVHLYSDKPLCTADWYVQHLGGVRRGVPRDPGQPCEVPYGAPSEPLAVIRSPAATVRFDDISLIIYPRQRPGAFVPSSGHVVDHIALSVSDVEATVDRLERSGVKVLRGVRRFGARGAADPAQRATRAALIQGPDLITIELVERP